MRFNASSILRWAWSSFLAVIVLLPPVVRAVMIALTSGKPGIGSKFEGISTNTPFTRVKAAVRTLAAGGCAIIYVTHRLAEVFELSHRVTVLRNGQYIENLPVFLAPALQSGDLALPPDGPTAWVSRVDLAEGIARLLLSEAPPRESVLLTGPEAIDFNEIASIASRALGRDFRRRIISGGEFFAALAARGLPTLLAQSLVTGFASRAAGELSEVDPALELLLGRQRFGVAEVLPHLFARTTGPNPAAIGGSP